MMRGLSLSSAQAWAWNAVHAIIQELVFRIPSTFDKTMQRRYSTSLCAAAIWACILSQPIADTSTEIVEC